MCTLSSDYSISWPASSYWPNREYHREVKVTSCLYFSFKGEANLCRDIIRLCDAQNRMHPLPPVTSTYSLWLSPTSSQHTLLLSSPSNVDQLSTHRPILIVFRNFLRCIGLYLSLWYQLLYRSFPMQFFLYQSVDDDFICTILYTPTLYSAVPSLQSSVSRIFS